MLLEAEPDFRVVGEAADGLEAAAAVERLQPDVLVLDLMMPGLSGLEVVCLTAVRWPGTKVVVLSMHSSEAHVLEALRNGAAALVLKRSSADELVHAVREVVAGRSFLSRPPSQRAIGAYREQAMEKPPDSYDKLADTGSFLLNPVGSRMG